VYGGEAVLRNSSNPGIPEYVALSFCYRRMVIGTRFLEVEYPVDEKGHPSREDCDKVAWPNYHFRFQNNNNNSLCV
jgi:hypothetical protein